MRNSILRIILPLANLLCVPSFLLAQDFWEQTNEPFGGAVYCFAVSSTNLFAGTNGGVVVSTNNGTSWTQVNNGLTYAVEALAVSGTNLFAGTFGGGVFLSTDNGTSWTQAGLTSTYYVEALAVNGTNLFAGTDRGVFLSTNNGASWTQANNGLTRDVAAFAVSGTNLFAGTNSDGGVFLSTNNGASWNQVGLINTSVVALAFSGTNLFAGTYDDGVFLSTDNGTSWTQVNNGLTSPYVQAFAVSGANVFAGTGDGVFLSTDNGTSWRAINSGLTAYSVLSLVVNSDRYVFAGTWAGGVFKSTNPVLAGCPMLSVPPYYQCDLPWGPHVLDHTDPPLYIKDYGCAITSVVMVLRSLDITTDRDGKDVNPDNLNDWLKKNHPEAYVGGNLWFPIIVIGNYTGHPLSFDRVYGRHDDLLNQELCNGRSVILEEHGHFIVATGQMFVGATPTWTINDPYYNMLHCGHSNRFNLYQGYNNKYRSLGIFRPTSSNFERVISAVNDTSAQEALVLAVRPPAQLLVTDQANRRTGIDSSGNEFDSIPGASYYLQFTTNDSTQDTMATAVNIFEHLSVTDGQYTVQLFDSTGSVDSLEFIAYSQAGNPTVHFVNVHVGQDSVVNLRVQHVGLQLGWNMVSVPLTVADYGKGALFPTAISKAFAYQGSYVVKDTLVKGRGYWLKFQDGQAMSMIGTEILADTIPLTKGWNMIGSISVPIACSNIESIPGGTVTSNFFRYAGNYYVSDSIRPGQAYWVKSNQDGRLILSSSGANLSDSKIRIAPSSERPPPPPEGVDRKYPGTPAAFSLDQNYPNPFNPVTTIKYSLAAQSKVALKIFNVLGQEIATLLDGVQEAGYHEIMWSGASNIGSGVYYYRLQAGSLVQTKKLLLLR